ncbi:MAG: DNA polymerase III subunit alpha [Caldilinea sp.]|nr:DNA polymerase III subunit alpha [Caldilinea sp.]
MADDFVHLHVHSEYSLLDGLGRVKLLVKEAARLGQPALALTDHGVMHGAIEFFRACRDANIKPIIGVEAYETAWGRPMGGRDPQLDRENYHLLLLARNMTGYRNLLKIASHSQTDGYYYKPRVDHEYLAAHAEGIIASTGCLGAEVPQLLYQGKEREAYERLGWYVDVFGKENFFIELQEHSIPELVTVNKTLVPWAEKFGLNLVATNDVHYVREQDGGPHDVLLCVQTGVTIDQPNRMRMTDGSYFLKSRAQMEATFRPFIDLPDSAFEHSLRIAEMCEIDLEDPTYHLPDLPIPEGYTYETYLRHLTEEGLKRLYGARATDSEVQERKERELRIIHEMGFDIYYLIVADLCDFARSRNIWWNVRGSGAGSLVAYCTGITGIDPLKNNLIFERFLNPGRVTMPDFDLDYPDDQREEMIRYTVEKYGEDQVAQIATFNRMKAKAAVRDVGRAQGIELAKVDYIAKLIPGIPGKPVTIQDCLTEGHEFYSQELVDLYAKEAWVKTLLDTAMQLEGVARNAGIHAAAVIVADRELTHYTPIMRGSKSTVTSTIAQYEFPILESIGLLKVDFLGLSTLSVMREAGRLIKERHGIEYTLENIPYEGEVAEDAFTLLSSGEVSGVFQVESQGMRRVLTEMKPSTFEHIVAMISLYRPGPLEYIPAFIRRMHGEEPVEYKHPLLAKILEETYGIIVYQEQIIQLLSELAGYTPGEADLLRRAIGKKKASEIEKHKKIFIAGCEKNGIDHGTAEAIYGDIEFFARYGFNKCLPGDTEVLDAQSGLLMRIEDIFTGKVQLSQTVTCDTDTLKLRTGNVAAVMHNGVKPVYRLTTALGRTIKATANHPFYTFDGWRLLEELAVGTQIATPRMLPVSGSAQWHDHEVIALGHLLAEGNLCHPHSVYFYSKDEAQCEDYVLAAESFDNVTCSTALHKGTYSIYAKRVDSSRPPGIFTWAGRLGLLGKQATVKEIPDEAFRLGSRQLGLLISRMWEGDGHINDTDRSLFYATSSERLAHQLQHLLLRLGIISRLRTVNFPYRTGRIGYQLFVTGNENLVRFRDTIAVHFVSPARQAKLDRLSLENVATQSTKDVVPISVKSAVREAKERAGLTWLEINEQCGVAQREFYPTGAAGKNGFARLTIQRLADFFGDDTLQRAGYSDIYWDKIVNIEYVGEEQTYDLEVPDTHNFVANDILVHNSHAADYAVITVQTAYLKAHYPVEYMAAQLLVERDKTEKVINFVSECRRMGIDVLPPDVNYSGLDFEIQQRPPETPQQAQRDPSLAYAFPVPEGSAIRFGMAAVKNVGEGPVRVIIEARQEGGPFKSLEEFCDRVDLRQVNKRALECLIKVGALDRFGRRSQLLAMLDQMVGSSASVHDARDSGQLSIFDLMSGGGSGQQAHVSPMRLPDIEEVKGREKLQWEKELLGVYSISHPLQQMGIDFQKVTTCSCAELGEAYDGKGVTLAGVITNVRTINTKKGDQMAFVQLEDLQGGCEVVFFPKAFAEYKDKLVVDSVVIVKGKAQTRDNQTTLLADILQTHVESYVTGADEPIQQTPLFNGGPTINGTAFNGNGAHDDELSNGYDAVPAPEANPFQNDIPDWMQDGSAPPPLAVENAVPGSPVAETAELDGEEDEASDLAEKETIEPATSAAPPSRPIAGEPSLSAPAPARSETAAPAPAAPAPNGRSSRPSAAVAEAPAAADRYGAPRQAERRLLITFRRSGNLERDKYRLKELYDTVRDPKGRDGFVIRLVGSGTPAELSFPNDACTISDKLTTELQKHFRVEFEVL